MRAVMVGCIGSNSSKRRKNESSGKAVTAAAAAFKWGRGYRNETGRTAQCKNQQSPPPPLPLVTKQQFPNTKTTQQHQN